MNHRTLILVPTYNELHNASAMCEELFKLKLDADVLFIDDDSPDGTGVLLDTLKTRFSRLIVQHRYGRRGIGSAHLEAINWAYDHDYKTLVTLDCDFTHSPSDIPVLLKTTNETDVAIGSRWLQNGSLPGWNMFRRAMTNLGHILTRYVLGLPHDASGAFRAYRLDKIPREVFSLIKSQGYAFFFESLFILKKNGASIHEIPIVLPARTYGNSKMTAAAAARSARHVFELALSNLKRPEQFLLEPRSLKINPSLVDPQGWDSYWKNTQGRTGKIYDIIAAIYRQTFIKNNIERIIFSEFPDGSQLLHAGCGGGQADTSISRRLNITALDISPPALQFYSRNNPNAGAVCHGSILDLPFPDASFDGYYNMGVVEHFTHEDIRKIFQEAARVLRPGGKLVIFWPHARATSVFVLRIWHLILHRLLKKHIQLHPAEISLLKSKSEAEFLLRDSGLALKSYSFGPRDIFIQSVIVAQKPQHS
jgi:dolichol-phosphate mannosyltransferase